MKLKILLSAAFAVAMVACSSDMEGFGGAETGNVSGLSPQFKAYLLTENLITYDGWGYSDTGKKIDSNGDGEISVGEAKLVEYIEFEGDTINKEELQGLEFFQNLKYLSIRNVSNTALNLSNNTALKELSCYDNQLTTLDVSKNRTLEYLHCSANQLTTLDLSNKREIEYLFCY